VSRVTRGGIGRGPWLGKDAEGLEVGAVSFGVRTASVAGCVPGELNNMSQQLQRALSGIQQ
jgi:hypothetical protein